MYIFFFVYFQNNTSEYLILLFTLKLLAQLNILSTMEI